MPKLIKTLHDRINFAIKKGLSGTVSPDRITEEAWSEILNIWRKYLPEYEKTRKIGLYLSPFEKREAVTVDGGTLAEGSKLVTACYEYPISVVTTSGVHVQILTIGEYVHRFNHPIKGPEAGYPICKFEHKTIYVAPRTDVIVTHLSKPTKPVYVFTQTGDDYIYDDVSSVDIDLPEALHDDVVNRVLANIGINMQDATLINYSDRAKTTENQ